MTGLQPVTESPVAWWVFSPSSMSSLSMPSMLVQVSSETSSGHHLSVSATKSDLCLNKSHRTVWSHTQAYTKNPAPNDSCRRQCSSGNLVECSEDIATCHLVIKVETKGQ